jgi:hypothetical protein
MICLSTIWKCSDKYSLFQKKGKISILYEKKCVKPTGLTVKKVWFFLYWILFDIWWLLFGIFRKRTVSIEVAVKPQILSSRTDLPVISIPGDAVAPWN